VHHAVYQAVALVKPQADIRHVALAVDPAVSGLVIEGDQDKLTQILLNVLLNAVQFSPEGGRVQVRCGEQAFEHGKYAVVTVIDEGPGIAETDRERVFDPFFSTREHGTGLGLSIASRLIDEHRGYIEVQNGRDCGAEFSLFLPLASRG
jgi:signal transduction histidine kinase